MSTVVYQGHAGKLAPQDIRMVNQFATDGMKPAHTFVLDLPVEVAMERLGDTLDRMESRGTEYFRNVRQGFLHEAEQERHCSVIDATETVDQIAERIQAIVANIIQ
jgi:dTMP kinase